MCHNPYFNRWFSAILLRRDKMKTVNCHNPYFNRWFSAIEYEQMPQYEDLLSQSLF